eukprot:2093864-Pyramimonas_sp.AAC.1
MRAAPWSYLWGHEAYFTSPRCVAICAALEQAHPVTLPVMICPDAEQVPLVTFREASQPAVERTPLLICCPSGKLRPVPL